MIRKLIFTSQCARWIKYGSFVKSQSCACQMQFIQTFFLCFYWFGIYSFLFSIPSTITAAVFFADGSFCLLSLGWSDQMSIGAMKARCVQRLKHMRHVTFAILMVICYLFVEILAMTPNEWKLCFYHNSCMFCQFWGFNLT